MVHIPPEHERSNEATSGNNALRQIRHMGKKVWKTLLQSLTGEISKEDAIQPDFRIPTRVSGDLTWYQNKSWGPLPEPEYKIGFYFNDPSVLNGCPWVCKFGKNLNPQIPDFEYFCVAYGSPHLWKESYGITRMLKWAMKFDHPSLMKYDGKLIKMLKEEDAPLSL